MLKESRSRSPWLQFSIRTLLSIMILTAGFCAGYMTARRQAIEAEQRANQQAEQAMRMAEVARMEAERAAAIAQYQQSIAAATQQLRESTATKSTPSEIDRPE